MTPTTASSFQSRLIAVHSTNDVAQMRRFCNTELPRFVKALAEAPPAEHDGRTMDVVDIDGPQFPYRHLRHVINGQRFHWGQLKLFCSEIEFLSIAVRVHGFDLFKKIDAIVYAGAADGKHIPVLVDLFPPTKWHLYDPARFDAGLVQFASDHPDKVTLHNEYFTDDVAVSYADKRVLFISDVRRIDHEDDANSIRLKIGDHGLQAQWVKLMNPIASMLKFAPPYEHMQMQYFDGLVMTQVHPGDNSTECRMIFSGIPPDTNYDTGVFESVLCYHNRVRREHDYSDEMLFHIPTVDEPICIDLRLVDHPPFVGHDTWRMMQILLMYTLTRESQILWCKDREREHVVDPKIDRSNYNHIPAKYVTEILQHPKGRLEKMMNEVIQRFVRVHCPFVRHIVRHKIKRSNFD